MSLQKYVFTYSKMFRLIRRKKCKEKSRTYMITTVGLGWASLLGKDRNYQERSHRSEKNEHIERVLKNIGTIVKRTSVERTDIA